jgi:hypothetical protein
MNQADRAAVLAIADATAPLDAAAVERDSPGSGRAAAAPQAG